MSNLLRVVSLGFLLSACVSPPPEVDEANQPICREQPECGPCYHNAGVWGCTCAKDVCPSGQTCNYNTGYCQPPGPPVCTPGRGNCDGNDANGCETSLSTISNCGRCGVTCTVPAGGSAACVNGICHYACSASQALICQ